MQVPKILVRYLPQFHQILENDEWWGEGFTEWTAVKNGTPLFSEHNQPRVPLRSVYYDLMNKKTMQWQAELAQKYNIGGFCFYHYWFKNGKRILEKPAENLLKWQDIKMPFCFTWANETWARTWSKLNQKNSWADNFEEMVDRCNKSMTGILLEQKYGDKEEWKEHFYYLLPFFKDQRYLKKDNKPIFVIYRPDDIACLGNMMKLWSDLAKKEGFDGIYLIGETWEEYVPLDNFDARLIRFPNAAFVKMEAVRGKNGLKFYDYDECWRLTLQEDYQLANEKKSYLCGVVDFDTTPRKGERGEVLSGCTVEKFHSYFDNFVYKNLAMENEYIFLNAWNEWGEGMYLEPDEANKYGYLESIKSVVDKYSAMKQNDYKNKTTLEQQNLSVDKKREFEYLGKKLYRAKRGFHIFSAWLNLKENGKTIAEYLLKKNLCTIAIYGLGTVGHHLIEELRNSEVEIKYVIDRDAASLNLDYVLYKLQIDLPNVDAIIVTPIGQYDEIKRNIEKYVSYPSISLEEIILECQ